jgi:hypothetical protein
VAFVAARLCIKKLPAALCGIIDGVLVARDEAIERRIKQGLRSFVGRDRAHQVRSIGRATKDGLQGLLIFPDRREPGDGSIHAGLAHFKRIDDR